MPILTKISAVLWLLWQWPRGIYLHTKLVALAIAAVVWR